MIAIKDALIRRARLVMAVNFVKNNSFARDLKTIANKMIRPLFDR